MIKICSPVGSGAIRLGANRRTYDVPMPEGDNYLVFGCSAVYTHGITVKQFTLIGNHGIFWICMPDGAHFLRTPLRKVPSSPATYQLVTLDRTAIRMGKDWKAGIDFVERADDDKGTATYWKGFPGSASIEILFMVSNPPEVN